MIPGDMIEWVHKINRKVVDKDEELWSSIMKEYVSIGIPSILISIDDESYSWLNEKGLFHVHVNDTTPQYGCDHECDVVSRVRE